MTVTFIEAHVIEEQAISQCIFKDPLTLNISYPQLPCTLSYLSLYYLHSHNIRETDVGIIAVMARSLS